MRKCCKIAGIALTMTALMPAASHAFTRVTDPVTDLPEGAIVALQSPSTTGGTYYFFNGAAHKTAPTGDANDPSFTNFYVVHRLENTDGKATFTLKRISNGEYIGRNGGTVMNTTNAANAVQFVASCPMTLHSGEAYTREDIVKDVTDGNLIRLTDKSSLNTSTVYKLNIQGTNSNPNFAGGTGGWSAWCINVYTADEICALMPWLSKSDTGMVSTDGNVSFPDNTFVSLQCLDTNGGSFYYLNGATAKSATLSTENLYKVCAGSSSNTFTLQRVSDGIYIGKSGGSVSNVSDATNATIFTAAIISADNWTTRVPGIGNTNDNSTYRNGNMTVRFTISGTSNYLNSNAAGGTPQYTGGTGGYSIWGVKVYPPELAILMKKEDVGARISNAWSRVVPEKELEAIDNAIATTAKAAVTYSGNLHNDFNTIENSAYADVYDSVYSIVDGLMVTLNNVRRGGETPNYLYATDAANHYVNTHTTVDERSKWVIVHPEGTAYFHLLNPATQGYIKEMEHNTSTPFTTDTAEAGRYDLIPHPAVHNGESTGIMVKKHGDSMALNVNTNGDPLVFWNNMSDLGSEWIMSFTEAAADELKSDGTYYRMRSHHGLTDAAGSLLAVNTVLGDNAAEGEAQELKLTADPANIGTLWQLTAEGKLENVAADFTGHDRYGLTAGGTVGEAAETATVASHANSTFACGISFGENNLAINDDETFYFEEVPAAEAKTIIENYVALTTADANIKATLTEFDHMKNAPALWDAETVAAADSTARANMPAISVKEANGSEQIDVPEEMTDALAEVYNTIIGKSFHFANRHDDNTGHHLYVNDGHLQSSATASYDVKTVWQILGTETPGEYLLYNYHDQTFAGFNETSNGIIPTSAEGEVFRLEYPTEHWTDYDILENEIVIHAITGTGSDHDSHYICDSTNEDHSDNTSVSAFRRPHAGSHWIVSEASEGMEVTVTYNEATNNIEFSHSEFAVKVNEFCTLRLPMLYSTVAEAETEAETEEPATFAAAKRAPESDEEPEGHEMGMLNNDNISQLMTGDLPTGNHRLEIPMGYFKVGDSYSKAITENFVKSTDGVVTSISDVTADASESAVRYFDLQGRRVSNPAGGVYLMLRGTKVSKVLLR